MELTAAEVAELRNFLRFIFVGNAELSHEKIRAEYMDFRKKASELEWRLFSLKEYESRVATVFNDNF